MFSYFYTTDCEAYSFTTDGYEIFNMHTHLGACHTYEVGSGTDKSAQELTRMDKKEKEEKSCLSSNPTRGSNPGSSDLNSDVLTTELGPLFYVDTYPGDGLANW